MHFGVGEIKEVQVQHENQNYSYFIDLTSRRTLCRVTTMPDNIRLSHQSLRVLRVFLDALSDDIGAELAGADIMSAARLSSGTLYPILLRFEKQGLLESRWEKERPEKLGRPRRRFYRMTKAGARIAHDALGDLVSANVRPSLRD